MTYKGVVRGGTVVLEPGVELPEGARVEVAAGSENEVEARGEPSLDEALERLYFLFKVRRGLEQADAGLSVSHAEARQRLAPWLA